MESPPNSLLDDDDVLIQRKFVKSNNGKNPRNSKGDDEKEAYDSDDEPLLSLFQGDGKSALDPTGELQESESGDDFPADEDDESVSETKNSTGKDEESSSAPSKKDVKEAQKRIIDKENQQFSEELEKQKVARLKFLLEQTTLYSTFLSQKLQSAAEEVKQHQDTDGNLEEEIESPNGNNKKRKGVAKSNGKAKKGKTEAPLGNTSITLGAQPKLLSGGVLRHYQLQGVEWMISLYENGLNGILADEMGLGKTIQVIALFAHLWTMGVNGPFLVVAPLSTIGNWVREVQQWAPELSVVKYHGSKPEREEVRKKSLGKKKDGGYPIVVTSYEIAMKDRKYLQRFLWKYIVVDEGHRLKNKHCKLIKELKFYTSANKLLLSGTPLQNNLGELWTMLNFLLPTIFDDPDSFQGWFDFSAIGNKEGEQKIIAQQERDQIVTKLHQILRPFLLRRVKTDVELELPKKAERMVNTTLSDIQKKYYHAILHKQLQDVLSAAAQKQLKAKGTSLQNQLMQLRKVCNHPYLLEWPTDSQGNELIDDNMIKSAGKLQLLDRLLPRLKKEGHKVLIFSQMTRMLDILEDYMRLRMFSFCRLDGQTAQVDRESQMKDFNSQQDIFCFLLSTRAGGLGINLTAADCVIFYDNDWNPQMDLQAQDRCHRIGQTKSVRVYRLATANSIESRILERQEHKMKLERLVIHKGNFVGVESKSKINSISELEELLSHEVPKNVGTAEEITDDVLFKWEQ